MKIICTEKEKENLLEAITDTCPFEKYKPSCGEDSRCDECVRDNIEFEIQEETNHEQT